MFDIHNLKDYCLSICKYTIFLTCIDIKKTKINIYPHVTTRHKSSHHAFGGAMRVRAGNDDGGAYLRSSPMLVLKLNMKGVAPLWGRAKAAPMAKARTFKPPPTERPDMKSRL